MGRISWVCGGLSEVLRWEREVELGRNGRGALYEGHLRLSHVEIPDWKECSRQRRMWLTIQVRKAHSCTRKTSPSSFIENVLQLL